MPRHPKWYARVEPALAVLQEERALLVSRHYVEELLDVSPRQANRVMSEVGYDPPDQKSLISNKSLQRYLGRILGRPEYQVFEETRVKVAHDLERKRRHEIAAKLLIEIDPRMLGATFATLPPSITVEKGQVSVKGETAEEIAGDLFQLANAMLNDIEVFRARLEGK